MANALALQQALLFTLIPVAATITGGALAAWRPPGPVFRSFVQHFAAGVVFAAVAGEVLPDIVHQQSPLAVAVGFSIGVGFMLVVKHFGEQAKGVAALLSVVAVDVAIDGLVIGLGFAAGGNTGPLLVFALTIELVFLGLSVAASLTQVGTPPLKIVAATALISALLPMGAAVGAAFLGGFSSAPLAAFLSFALAALLYLVVEELLVEAHEKRDLETETPAVTVAFFVGFLALLLIEEVTR